MKRGRHASVAQPRRLGWAGPTWGKPGWEAVSAVGSIHDVGETTRAEQPGPGQPARGYSRRRVLGLIGAAVGVAAGAGAVATLAEEGGLGPLAPGGGGGAGPVVPYPRIDSLTTSGVYRVFAGDREIWTEEFSRTRTVHVANFAATGPVPIRIEVDGDVSGVEVSPRHRGPEAERDGSTVRFTVAADGPRKLIVFVETGGDRRDPLYLLIDDPEANPPTAGTDRLTYFGPGTHRPGEITLNAGDGLYLAPGALVVGRVVGQDAAGVSIGGRGILQEPDEARDPRALEDSADFHTIVLKGCPDARVDGITVRDVPRGWTSRYTECDRLRIRGLKIFSFKVNGDGIDPDGCQDVTIENCLVSTGDDAIVIKSTKDSRRSVSNITVSGCVLETYPKTTAGEGGDAFKIGTETYCPEISGVRVRDCDIVRAHGGMAFSIMHRDAARIHDVRFTDVRVEGDVENQNFGVVMLEQDSDSSSDSGAGSGSGSVSDVVLRDVAWSARRDIVLQGAGVSGVRFENCTVAGRPLATVETSDGADDPTIDP